ncbi:hypothetical protein D0463_00615 [Bacillus sp. V59.32b]|nr:hypothetical protein D0463_00615 [Bacillus sp. V59.32b]
MDIQRYKSKLSDVFQINAITVDKDYFMLTHKPFKRIKMVSKGLFLNGEKFFHENELYNTIMDNRDKHQFHVVKGDNGSGKSHLIRWIKEHYETDAKNEAVIFISRMQSTLKGALQQIINAEVIQNHETSHKLKNLIEANNHLDKAHLKNIILAHLNVAVQEDDDTRDIKLRRSKRLNLYDFLSSHDTRDFMLRDNGPLDRIQKKLAPSVNNEIMDEVNPHFLPEDFKITSAESQEFKRMKDISPRALRFIGSIQEAFNVDDQEEVEEFRAELARYLNQFLDKVVQECLSLRGTDLKEIFVLLRQELKKEGKNLTLFIEDITSFTGVDKDLVDVLIADHEEEKSLALCRLVSLVGITNGYYNTSLPGNIIDRITSHIEIDNVVMENKDESAELAARYINAVYLEDDQILEWKNTGYRLEEFPVATAFRQHSWANVTVDNDLELSIFPFTKAALWNFYVHLETKTPRSFLQTVLLQYIQKYALYGPRGQFPPNIGKVLLDFKRLPNWKDTSLNRVLSSKVSADEKGRYETLFRIWGNGTLDEQMVDGRKTVGGLEDDVFESFKLKPISGIQGRTAPKPDPAGARGGDGIPVSPKPNPGGGKRPIIKPVLDPPTVDPPVVDPLAIDPPVVVPPSTEPSNPDLENAISEIERWSKGEPLDNNWMIGDILDIIREYIHWDLEGISTLIVKDFLTNNYVLIEGQSKAVKVKEENALIFRRNDTLRYTLEGLASYRYEGNKTWDFPNSSMALLSLHTWLEIVKDDIVSFLQKPFDYKGNDWAMEEYLVSAEFYSTALLSGFKGTERSPEEIYLQLLKDKNKNNIKNHNKTWEASTNYLNLEHTDLFRRYFNLLQGETKRAGYSSLTFFYDAFEIIGTIKKITSKDFALVLDGIPKGKSNSWYTSVNILPDINQRIQSAAKEEISQSTNFVNNIQMLIGDEPSKDVIEKIIKSMAGFLDYLKQIKEPFQHSQFEVLYNNVLNYPEVAAKIHVLKTLEDTSVFAEQLVALSNSPALQVQPFYLLLDNFNKLVEQKNNDIAPKISSLKTELQSYSGDPITALKQDLLAIKEVISELDERSISHVVK